jgi:hypothetical protein
MKIIGGKKDYFDYLVGYYGYDDHLVWDRRPMKDVSFKWKDRFLFYICGEIFPVLKKKHDFIFSPDDARLTNTWARGVGRGNFERDWMEKWYGRKTRINVEMRQPLLCSGDYFGIGERKYFIPCLADFGFGGYIEAHEMYSRIYAFLGWLKDHPAPPDNQTDKEKIVSHGFSPKTSFRPNIKN